MSDFDCKHFGDSARNKPFELKCNNSNHIFDGAGENIQYHSDSESVGSRKSKTRYINPAIYIETVESTHSATSLQSNSSYIDDVTPHPHSSYRSSSTPYLTGRVSSPVSSCSVQRKSCRLGVDGRHDDATPRNNCTYREDGHDTFRLSVASLSTTTTAKEERERNEHKKQEAFNAWLARKEQERRNKLRLEKAKQNPQPRTSQQQREESYRHWLECKKRQKERQRAEEIMKRFRETERIEAEKKKKVMDKEEKLAEWIRRKEEEIKSEHAMKTREERKAARAQIEEERRKSKGEKAYRDWLRTSKNKPLPVPLNQGELSMRGSISQMYINPVPWQSS